MRKKSRLKWFRREVGRFMVPDCTWKYAGEAVRDIPVSGVAEIYRSEIAFVLRCILERPHIETGGELFGFWKDNGTPVVAYAIGPGPFANHETAFFNQDLAYLTTVGSVLTAKYGLEHIGEWHSHHGLGLSHPSGHDAATIAHGMYAHERNRFLLCIGTCSGRTASLGGFAFAKGSGEHYAHVDWRVINVDSPYRGTVDGDDAIARILINPMTMEEIKNGSYKA